MWSVTDTGLTADFPIKRVYYLVDSKADRGGHSHRKLKQVAVAVAGAVTFVLEDEAGRSELRLDNPRKGLFLGPGTWREMRNFSPDCVLVVLASEPYDEADYIRDYNEFLADQAVNAEHCEDGIDGRGIGRA